MWGVSAEEYMRVAEPWPLNPDGELLFGLKIENPRADANVESSVRVPGIAFAEWGPGDHGFFLLGRPGNIRAEAKRRLKWRRCGAACSTRPRLGDQVPQCLQREQRDRSAEGRRDDLHGRGFPGRRQGPRLHQANRSLVGCNRAAVDGCRRLPRARDEDEHPHDPDEDDRPPGAAWWG